MVVRLDAATVRRWCACGLEALERFRAEIDELNVYPVADSDTGTNLAMTMRSVVDGLDGGDDIGACAKSLTRSALLGARGNSGVILSQWLRGLAEGLTAQQDGDPPVDDASNLADALNRAAERARAAVPEPVEGTVLTVATAAAEGAADTDAASDLAAVASAAARAAADALARTPEQLPVLAAAGVVDAGGRGLVVLLDALACTVGGEPSANGSTPQANRHAGSQAEPGPIVERRAGDDHREAGSDEFDFEVMYLLSADDTRVAPLRHRLGELGDSVLVVGGHGVWNVHVHCNDVGAAVEAGLDVGRPHRIRVTHFGDQMRRAAAERQAPAAEQALAEDSEAALEGRVVIALVPGEGVAELFRAAGAVVSTGLPDALPGPAELADMVRRTGAAEVVLLPNHDDLVVVAQQAADLTRSARRTVTVVPTRAPVQGIAALAVADPDRPLTDVLATMSAAAGATRFGEVTRATEDALTSVGPCRAGDVLGLIDGDVAVIGDDLAGVSITVVDRMLDGGGELVTLVTGQGAGDLGERVAGHLRQTRPGTECVVYDGRQPVFPLLVGVE